MQCNASTKAPSEGSDVLALGNINGGHEAARGVVEVAIIMMDCASAWQVPLALCKRKIFVWGARTCDTRTSGGRMLRGCSTPGLAIAFSWHLVLFAETAYSCRLGPKLVPSMAGVPGWHWHCYHSDLLHMLWLGVARDCGAAWLQDLVELAQVPWEDIFEDAGGL